MKKFKKSLIIAVSILLIASLALFIAYGDNGLVELNSKKAEKKQLIIRNQKLQKEILSDYRQVDRLKNDLDFIKVLAKHELGWVEKDEVVFKIRSKTTNSNNRPMQ